jgi:hypothetical protein
LRIDKQPPGRPGRTELQHGQTVQGRIVEKDGRHFLQHAGGRTAVTVEGRVPEGVARFHVRLQQGKIILQELPAAATAAKPESARLLSENIFRLFPDAARRLGEGGRLSDPGTPLLEFLFQGLVPLRDAGKAAALLRVYERKKGTNLPLKDADTTKEVLQPFFDALGVVLDSSAAEEREAEEERSKEGRQEEIAFVLLPLAEPDGDIRFIPVLTLGIRHGARRAWLFSECEFSRIGCVRVALFQAGGTTTGMVVCEPGKGKRLESLAGGGRYRILERTLDASFGVWPFQVLGENEEGYFDGTI